MGEGGTHLTTLAKRVFFFVVRKRLEQFFIYAQQNLEPIEFA